MTRKHFQAIAITLGQQMRLHAEYSDGWNAVWGTAAELARDFRATNSRFDDGRFLTFVSDVAAGRRDLDGKAVAA